VQARGRSSHGECDLEAQYCFLLGRLLSDTFSARNHSLFRQYGGRKSAVHFATV
jgi:hypothetical protein